MIPPRQDITPLENILPDEPLLMMGAGPVPIPEKVAKANAIVVNHLGDTMAKVIDQVKAMAAYVFQTQSPWIMGVAGPGSASMEMAIANLVWKDTKVISICNGFFSHRLAEMAERNGADVCRYQIEGSESASPEQVESYLKSFKPDLLTIVQGETSNTVWNQHLPKICQLAKKYQCLVIVDAVCTLSTMPLNMDEWGIDAIITGGQKGLSSIPGVSLIAFSEAAANRIHQRPEPMRHWCLDVKLAEQFWLKSSYHYTAPVSGILALHEALHLVVQETLEARFDRHQRCSIALQQGLEAMGLELHVRAEDRLNSVVGINVPKNIDQKQLCSHISQNYRVEIAGSFGLNIVRIGQMGEQCRVHNLFRTLHAFGSSLRDLGVGVDIPNGMATLEMYLQEFRQR